MSPTKPKDAKEKIVDAMMKNWERDRWIKYRAALHLHSEEVAERLTTLLAQHLLLDQMVTAVLSLRLYDARTTKSIEEVTRAVVRVNFAHRIELAKAAGIISDSCSDDIKAVNAVRNKLAHFQPKGIEGGVGKLPELSSMKEFDRCMRRGECALDELVKHINDRFKLPA